MAIFDGYRSLTAGKLKAVLADMPDDYELIMNGLGNITVYGPPGESSYKGYIDFGQAEEFIKDE